jgi:hypothetical protein
MNAPTSNTLLVSSMCPSSDRYVGSDDFADYRNRPISSTLAKLPNSLTDPTSSLEQSQSGASRPRPQQAR